MKMGARSKAQLGVLFVSIAVGACSGSADPSGLDSASLGAVASPTPSATSGATASQTTRPTRSPLPTIGKPADDGARIVKVATFGRTRDLTIESPAVGDVRVRLLIPNDYTAKPDAQWPVLFLLHGASGSYLDWTQYTDAQALLEPTDLLVVLPDAGDLGFYSDWWNGGKGGPPQWETFHTVELVQLLERNWHAGDKRAAAGLSMGGYGAFEYATRHPGMFLAVASYSGALNPFEGKLDIGDEDLWGDPIAQKDVWEAHDPTHHVEALKGTTLYLSYGDGGKGPLDKGTVPTDDLEPWIADQNRAIVAALAKARIPVTVDAYGPGSHDWPYWERGLHRSLPLLLKALGG